VIVFLGTVFEKYKSSQKFIPSFISSKNNVISLTKSWLGYILGDFFAISSGHPAQRERFYRIAPRQSRVIRPVTAV
jgi:hypothetical protein